LVRTVFDRSIARCVGECAAAREIAEWLGRLGMSEHTQRFAENDIDTSVLPHLTDENLKELGISLGHRVKLLAAIRELGGNQKTGESPLFPAAEPKPQGAAERRQVTVMFSDLRRARQGVC
jgi:SAM domain (Sterile alpha motif)